MGSRFAGSRGGVYHLFVTMTYPAFGNSRYNTNTNLMLLWTFFTSKLFIGTFYRKPEIAKTPPSPSKIIHNTPASHQITSIIVRRRRIARGLLTNESTTPQDLIPLLLLKPLLLLFSGLVMRLSRTPNAPTRVKVYLLRDGSGTDIRRR
jgi:hypothetical protein